jgi:hypothetical protein
MVLKKIGFGGAHFIQLAHDKNPWRAVVNAVMNLRVFFHDYRLRVRWKS